ncbi:DNA-binding protein (plasmid) [Deinococcus actinosclerus]|nr:DNA-binding protein [Deinococcus actinosclerus]
MQEVSVSEAAERFHYTPQHVRLLIRKGDVAARRSGGVWFVSLDSLAAYKASNPQPGPKPSGSRSRRT